MRKIQTKLLLTENVQIIDLLNPNNKPISCYQNDSVQVCDSYLTTSRITTNIIATTHIISTTQPPKGISSRILI